MYTKVIQYGDILEVYKYSQPVFPRIAGYWDKTGYCSSAEMCFKRSKSSLRYIRSDYTKNRALRSFVRLCHHNNLLAKTIHFLTLTYA